MILLSILVEVKKILNLIKFINGVSVFCFKSFYYDRFFIRRDFYL